jgi:demethylmenaquinone methyltransferase/2-methoxy-6-polyprenyl-1,4-benzoquinol methylase
MLEKAREKGLPNLVCADGTQLPFEDEAFDAVTVAFGLRNMADYPTAIREAARVIRRGGHYLVLDFSLPRPPLRAPYRWYLHRVLPHLAAAVTGDQGSYEYLGASIEEFPAGRAMTDLLSANGFQFATAHPLSGGIVTIYDARK